MSKIRYFAAFIAVVVFSSKVSAQRNPSSYYEEEPRVFYGGLLAGTNFAQVDGDSYAGYHKVGLNVGGIMYARIAEHMAFSMELLFSQKGSNGNKPQLSNSGAYEIQKYGINLNYAEIPIMFNYFDKQKSHFGAGFSLAQMISSSESVTTTPEPPGGNGSWSDTLGKYPFKKSDLNFVIGGNLHLVKGLFLNLRFQYSILSIRKDYYPEFGRAEQYNNTWTLRLMYLFQ